MHAQWQIAGLILLILLLAGILRRLVILIVTARSLRWSKLRQKAIDLTGQNLQTTNSNESGSGKPYFTIDGVDITDGQVVYRKHSDGREEYYPIENTPPAIELGKAYPRKDYIDPRPYGFIPYEDAQGKLNDDNSFGSTGFQPGGVSYTQVPQRGGALIPKGRKRFGRRK